MRQSASLLLLPVLFCAAGCEPAEGDVAPFPEAVTLSEDAPGELHQQTSVQCWDGTYGYNRLRIDDLGDELAVEISGAAVEIPGVFHGWGAKRLRATFPTTACFVAPDDRLRMSCRQEPIALEVKPAWDAPTALVSAAAMNLQMAQITELDAQNELREGTQLRVDLLAADLEHSESFILFFADEEYSGCFISP